jgi:hypothetical protein
MPARPGCGICSPPTSRIEPQFTALRYFALDGTDHSTHQEQGSMTAGTSSGATTTPTTNGSAASSSAQTLTNAALDRGRGGLLQAQRNSKLSANVFANNESAFAALRYDHFIANFKAELKCIT